MEVCMNPGSAPKAKGGPVSLVLLSNAERRLRLPIKSISKAKPLIAPLVKEWLRTNVRKKKWSEERMQSWKEKRKQLKLEGPVVVEVSKVERTEIFLETHNDFLFCVFLAVVRELFWRRTQLRSAELVRRRRAAMYCSPAIHLNPSQQTFFAVDSVTGNFGQCSSAWSNHRSAISFGGLDYSVALRVIPLVRQWL